MSLHIKVSDVWKNVAAVGVKVSGSWKDCADIFAKVGENWKSILYQPGTKTITEPELFTVPSGVYELTVQMLGAGGSGGAGLEMGAGGGGGGGGSGGYIEGTLAVTPYSVLNVIRLGVGGESTVTGNGGRSNFEYGGITYEAGGGIRGTDGGNGGGGSGGFGGSIGTGIPDGSSQEGIRGDFGETGAGNTDVNGGAGADSRGGLGTGGAGGIGPYGPSGVNGHPGTGYGSGGGGGGGINEASPGKWYGGDGTQGVVVLTW